MSESALSDYLIVGLVLASLIILTTLVFLLHSILFGATFAKWFARFPEQNDEVQKYI